MAPMIDQWTDEALMAFPHVGKTELINGKVIMAPTGAEHGDISSVLITELSIAIRPGRLGRVFDSSTGFRMSSGNVLAPDAAFVTREKLKGLRSNYKRFLKGAPDLVAETLSPNDSRSEVLGKIREYFQNGTTLAWIIDPDAKTVEILTSPDSPPQILTLAASATLTAAPLIPNFNLPLANLFESPDFD